jgi:hypothetical protein
VILGACFHGGFSCSAFFVSVFLLNKKARKMEKIKKYKRKEFARLKSPFVALIFNKYIYVVT